MGWKSFTNKVSGFLGGSGASLSSLTPGGVLDTLTGKDSMREQNEWNLQMWNLQNAYNTPSAQMKRFQEAGLNPNLIYGQTNTAGPVHASAGPMESGAGALSKIFSTVQAIKSMKLLGAQVANMQQQNKNLQSQDTLLGAQADYTEAQADRLKYETGWLKEHGTSSFEDPRIRSAKGSLGGYAQSFADVVGSGAGSVAGRIVIPRDEMVVKVKSFKGHDEELISLLQDMQRQGIPYRLDYRD